MNRMFRKAIAVGITAAVAIGSFTVASAQDAAYQSEKLNNLHFVEAVKAIKPFEEVTTHDCVVGKEDGKNILYSASTGKPASFNVYDMDNMKLLRTYPLTGTSAVEHNIDKDGNVYILTSTPAYLYRYSPVTKEVENLGSILGNGNAYQSCFDEEGNLYMGTYPSGAVVKYDPKTKKFTDYGQAHPNNPYVRSLSYYNGFLYAGSNGTGNAVMVKINPKNGEKKVIEVPIRPEYYTEVTNVYAQTVVGNKIITYGAAGKGNNVWMIFDPEKDEYTDKVFKNAGGGLYASPEKDGKSYLMFDGQIQELDLETLETTPTGIKTTMTNRKGWWVDFEGRDDGFGKNTMVTINTKGKPVFLNIDSKKVQTITGGEEMKGGDLSMQHIVTGPDDKIYAGAYLGSNGIEYDTKTGETRYFPMGQTENIKCIDDKLYFGVYAQGDVRVFDPEQEVSKTNPKVLFTIKNDQDRPYIIDDAGDYIIVGSIATYGKVGGALSIMNKKTGEYEVYRNVVKDQSIVGLAYKDGIIYGSTTTSGGLGIEYPEKKAKMFMFDLEKREKIKEWIPEWPAEMKGNVNIIGDIEVGPDGLLWCASKGYLFAMEPGTGNIVKSKVIGDVTFSDSGHQWQPRHIRFDKNGLLYITVGGINVVDPETMENIDLKQYSKYEPNLMDIDSEGNIYFGNAANMMKIAVTDTEVTSSDKKELYHLLDGAIAMKLGDANAVANGEIQQIDPANVSVRPITKDDRTLLPVRFIAESLGAEVGWDDATQTVTLKTSDKTIKLVIGSNQMDVNGNTVTLDVPAQTVNDRTLLPLRALAEQAFGKQVFWDDSGLIIVSDKENILDNTADAETVRKLNSYLHSYGPYDYTQKEAEAQRLEDIAKEEAEANRFDRGKVTNADFEEGAPGTMIPKGWSQVFKNMEGFTMGISDEKSYKGNQSFKLIDTKTDASNGILSDPIPVTPGKTLVLNTKLFINSGRTSVSIKFCDENINEIGNTISENVQTGQGQWQTVIVQSKVPDNAKYVRVMLSCSNLWITEAYYDNVIVYQQ